MKPERKAELREWATLVTEHHATPLQKAFVECLDDIDRLEAELLSTERAMELKRHQYNKEVSRLRKEGTT